MIETLGDFHRPETLPSLIKALAEDFSREAAEAAIRKLGVAARPALVRASTSRFPLEECESETSLRGAEVLSACWLKAGFRGRRGLPSGHWSAIATFAWPWLHASSVSISVPQRRSRPQLVV